MIDIASRKIKRQRRGQVLSLQACSLEEELTGGKRVDGWEGVQVLSGSTNRAREDVLNMGLSMGDVGVEIGEGAQTILNNNLGYEGVPNMGGGGGGEGSSDNRVLITKERNLKSNLQEKYSKGISKGNCSIEEGNVSADNSDSISKPLEIKTKWKEDQINT